MKSIFAYAMAQMVRTALKASIPTGFLLAKSKNQTRRTIAMKERYLFEIATKKQIQFKSAEGF